MATSTTTDFAKLLPKPTEVVETSFGFAERMLELQKAYALQLADVWTRTGEAFATAAGDVAERAKTAAKN